MTADNTDMRKRLEAFAADIYTVCEKHNMAIFVYSWDEDLELAPWEGWETDPHPPGWKHRINNPGPRLIVDHIVPGEIKDLKYIEG